MLCGRDRGCTIIALDGYTMWNIRSKHRKQLMAKSERSEIIIELDEIFGRPTLPRGDDRTAYTRFRKAIFEVYEPQDILGALEVQEIVDSKWLAVRYNKLSTVFMDGHRRKAVNKMSSHWAGFVSEEGQLLLENCKRNRVGVPSADDLKAVGLSVELVNAQALLLAAPKVRVFDELIANRNAASKTAHNNYVRNRRLKAKLKSKEDAAAGKTESHNDNRKVGGWGVKKRIS
jgi:hypothetical protein